MNIYKTVKNINLCIKYPFLFPRNRWTGLHYNNWTIQEWKPRLYKKAYMCILTDEESKLYKTNRFHSIRKSTFYAILYKLLVWYHDTFLQMIHCIPTSTELDAMPKGWRKCFGEPFCKEIKDSLLLPNGKYAKLTILQIKEKYGHLRFYYNGGTKETDKVVNKYEYISARTCIECGKTADYMTSYYDYAEPVCSLHLSEHKKERAIPYGTKENTWYGWQTISNKTNK